MKIKKRKHPYNVRPKPKLTNERCEKCNKRLSDFELLYGCSSCGRKKE